MVSYAQASCTGSNIAAVSEKGDLLLYSVSAITSELQQVCVCYSVVCTYTHINTDMHTEYPYDYAYTFYVTIILYT